MHMYKTMEQLSLHTITLKSVSSTFGMERWSQCQTKLAWRILTDEFFFPWKAGLYLEQLPTNTTASILYVTVEGEMSLGNVSDTCRMVGLEWWSAIESWWVCWKIGNIHIIYYEIENKFHHTSTGSYFQSVWGLAYLRPNFKHCVIYSR